MLVVCLYILLFALVFLKQNFSVALEAALELAQLTILAWNSQRYACVCLLSADIKGNAPPLPSYISLIEKNWCPLQNEKTQSYNILALDFKDAFN